MAITPDTPNPQIKQDDEIVKSYQPRGDARTFRQNKYSTGGLTYPLDLHGENNQYGGNYVIFYINVHEDSKLVVEGGERSYLKGANIPPREKGFTAGTNIDRGVVQATVIGAGAGTAVATDLLGRSTKAINSVTKQQVTFSDTVKDVGNVGLGVGIAAVSLTALGQPNAQYKRQKQAIALYMPRVSSKYSVNWREADVAGTLAIMGIVQGGVSGVTNLAKAIMNPVTGNDFSFDTAGKAIQSGIAAGAGALLGVSGGVGEVLQKTTGTAPNPKKEQLFKEVEFRTFQFMYQFYPRNESEAKAARDIIKEFKLHMHPEYRADTGQFLYVYPSEFDIFYYHNGKENLNIHRHTSCVLTDMSVDYGSQAGFTSFSDGMPTEITMTLTFKELALLTKEHILDNF